MQAFLPSIHLIKCGEVRRDEISKLFLCTLHWRPLWVGLWCSVVWRAIHGTTFGRIYRIERQLWEDMAATSGQKVPPTPNNATLTLDQKGIVKHLSKCLWHSLLCDKHDCFTKKWLDLWNICKISMKLYEMFGWASMKEVGKQKVEEVWVQV